MTAHGVRAFALRCVVAAVLTHGSAASADPYRYDLRSRFLREPDQEERPPGLDLKPRIDSAVYLVGNINLAEESSEEIDTAGIEGSPGLYASYRSNRADAQLDYSLIARAFEEDDYDSVSHLLAADGRYIVVPDLFNISAQAGYSDSIIDAANGTNYGGIGLFNRSNIEETGRASVTPSLTHQFGGFRFDASYTYGRVWYFESDDVANSSQLFVGFNEDSEDQHFNVSIGTNDPDNDATFKAFYEWQDSSFELSRPFRYERAGADASLRLTRTLSLVADGGVETDLTETTTDGGLDSDFWHAGFRWQPDSRTSVDARYGNRFFGDSWSLEARRTTRLLTLRASYVEDPEVETRRIGIDFAPDDFPLPPPSDLSGLSSSPYIRKDALLTAIVEGARTQIRLDAYDRNREYIQEILPDEETTGVLLSIVRDIGADLYGEISGRYEDITQAQRVLPPAEPGTTRGYDRDVTFRVTWQAYLNFMTSAEAGYLARSGDSNYDGEWFAVRFRYTF
jgi:hypothetical protein